MAYIFYNQSSMSMTRNAWSAVHWNTIKGCSNSKLMCSRAANEKEKLSEVFLYLQHLYKFRLNLGKSSKIFVSIITTFHASNNFSGYSLPNNGSGLIPNHHSQVVAWMIWLITNAMKYFKMSQIKEYLKHWLMPWMHSNASKFIIN